MLGIIVLLLGTIGTAVRSVLSQVEIERRKDGSVSRAARDAEVQDRTQVARVEHAPSLRVRLCTQRREQVTTSEREREREIGIIRRSTWAMM